MSERPPRNRSERRKRRDELEIPPPPVDSDVKRRAKAARQAKRRLDKSAKRRKGHN